MGKGHQSTYYQVHFRDPRQGEIVCLKARKVQDSSLGLSFICISDFVFESSNLLIKPSEEQLQKQLENVKSLHISIHTVISIEEVGKEHEGLKFKNDKSKLLVLHQDSPPQ